MGETMQPAVDEMAAIVPEGQRAHAMSRATFYAYLSAVFGQRPSSELVGLIRDGTIIRLVAGSPSACKHLVDLQRVASLDGGARLELDLAVEYTRLLVGPGPDYLPPYESVHAKIGMPSPLDCRTGPLENRGARPALLWGDAAAAVGRYYADAGLMLADTVESVPDHIATELDFLRVLCLAEAQAWEVGDVAAASTARSRQHDFLKAHLLAWVPDYCAVVERRARHPFYSAMAALTIEFLDEEAEEMERLEQVWAIAGGES